ncbi:glycosyl transferase [Methylorubrum populi]|nr:glycosyl transferase [Methylorubrum populi]
MTHPLPCARTAVVTRTKDRPLLLSRAMQSVTGQTDRDLVWVVVNDGGARTHVDHVVEEACLRGFAALAVHHEHSLGMQAASRAGIAASASAYIVIHDDDDSWEPGFLAEAAAFLDAKPHYAGVVTDTVRIDEEIRTAGGVESVVETGRSAYNPHVASIHLSEMAEENLFAPIAFLFRREVHDAVGGFDASLPNLGDWDFNLRFLAHADIGVLRRHLANYHWRVAATGSNGNSVADGVSRHIEMDARIRNKLLRRDLAEGRVGLGHLVAAGRGRLSARGNLNNVADRLGTRFLITERTMHRLGRIARAILRRRPVFARSSAIRG